MRRSAFVIGGVIAAGCGSAKPASEISQVAAPNAEAQQLMRSVERTYAGLSTYADEGVVIWYWADRPAPEELAFETHFRRPRDFRFEWDRIEWDHHVVWSNADGAFSWWDAEPGAVRDEEDLGTAISAATGISGGAVTSIPGLLVDQSVIWSIGDVRDLSMLEPAAFEGIECQRLRGLLGEDVVEIWISRDDHLIRRIVTRHPQGYIDGKLPMEEEIRRNVRFEHAIPDETFQFTPPP